MHCCHTTKSLVADTAFEDDEFTQAALRERRVRAAHAHGFSALLAVFGVLALFHVAHKRARRSR